MWDQTNNLTSLPDPPPKKNTISRKIFKFWLYNIFHLLLVLFIIKKYIPNGIDKIRMLISLHVYIWLNFMCLEKNIPFAWSLTIFVIITIITSFIISIIHKWSDCWWNNYRWNNCRRSTEWTVDGMIVDEVNATVLLLLLIFS